MERVTSQRIQLLLFISAVMCAAVLGPVSSLAQSYQIYEGNSYGPTRMYGSDGTSCQIYEGTTYNPGRMYRQ